MKLFVNEKEKNVLIESLRLYQSELLSLSKQVQSVYLRAGFEGDAERSGDLITKLQKVREDYDTLDRNIGEILSRPEGPNTSNLIHAIKYCRQETGWSLIDSKKYVENVRDSR
jgi:hypothetical protein